MSCSPVSAHLHTERQEAHQNKSPPTAAVQLCPEDGVGVFTSGELLWVLVLLVELRNPGEPFPIILGSEQRRQVSKPHCVSPWQQNQTHLVASMKNQMGSQENMWFLQLDAETETLSDACGQGRVLS